MRCGTKTRRLVALKFYKESNWTQEPLLLLRSLSPRMILKAYSLDSFRDTRHWRAGRVLNWNSGLSKKLHHEYGTLQDAFSSLLAGMLLQREAPSFDIYMYSKKWWIRHCFPSMFVWTHGFKHIMCFSLLILSHWSLNCPIFLANEFGYWVFLT